MMGWTFFSKEVTQTKSQLELNLLKQFPDDDKLARNAAIAGLCAVIAYSDLEITSQESIAITSALTEWTDLSADSVKVVAGMAQQHAKDFVDLENHHYTNVLNEELTDNQKYYLLESLFEIAAADGQVDAAEMETIRFIGKSLKLSKDKFLAAKATVMDKISSLK